MGTFYSVRSTYHQKLNNTLKECVECENIENKLTQPHLGSPTSPVKSPTRITNKEMNAAVDKLEKDFQKKSSEKDQAILDLHRFRV